jgi:Bardet-Biedl syndrome 9 protein
MFLFPHHTCSYSNITHHTCSYSRRGIKGFVVSLTDTCQVVVSYMGTDPPMQGVNAMDTKELDYEAMDDEHRKLLKVIKQAGSDKMEEPVDKLVLRAQVPTTLSTGVDNDVFEDEDDCLKDEQGKFVSVMVRLYVTFTGKEDLDDVSINLHFPSAFKTPKKCIILSTLRGGNRTPLVLNLRFRASKKLVPKLVPACACFVCMCLFCMSFSCRLYMVV